MHHLLGRSLDDLPPQTRRLLGLISSWVADQKKDDGLDALKFSRRELQRFTGWSYGQLRIHLDRLVEHDYVGQHGAGRGGRLVYELLDDGSADDLALRCPGLVDVAQLAESLGVSVPMTKVCTPVDGGLHPHCRGVVGQGGATISPHKNSDLEQNLQSLQGNAGEGGTPSPRVVMSYTDKTHAVSA
jgi:hypothetical protein